LQLSERDVRSILPVANNCGNVYVRFSTFFILENVGKIKNVKKRKKRFLHLWLTSLQYPEIITTLLEFSP